jgi:hypothetical protein
MNKIFYTYIHIRPDTNEPFYVGKGKGNRHKTKSGRNQYWHNIVNKNNGIFESKILFEGLSENEALNKEIEIEKELKDNGYNLVNLAETGKSGPVGVPRTEEHKQSLSKATKGRVSPNKGKIHGPLSEELKHWKGKNRPEETKIKQSFSQLNRWKEKGNELKQQINKKLNKMVIQIDPKTWSIINTFSSNKEAQEKTGINGINQVINGSQHTAGGYLWLGEVKDRPYFEKKINENEVIRLFNSSKLEIEELWHRDNENRTVEILGETNWKLQLDNQLPTSINEPIYIPRHLYHRVIKGTGNLLLKIHKS